MIKKQINIKYIWSLAGLVGLIVFIVLKNNKEMITIKNDSRSPVIIKDSTNATNISKTTEEKRPSDTNTREISPVTAKVLQKSWDIQHKALLSRDETIEYEKLLSNTLAITESAQMLRTTQWAALEEAKSVKRLQAINYLEAALRINGGAVREHVLTEIVNTVVVDWSKVKLSDEARRIILGDQVELFRVLIQYEPQRAERLEDDAMSSHKRRLFNYARNLHASNE